MKKFITNRVSEGIAIGIISALAVISYLWAPSLVKPSNALAATMFNATLVAAPTTCTIPVNGNSCTIPFSWSFTNKILLVPVIVYSGTLDIYNATRGVSYVGYVNASNARSIVGAASYTITKGVNTIQARDATAGIVIASTSVTGNCAAGTVWNGSVCLAVLSGTLSASPTTCTIPIGGSTCTVPFTWNIIGAASPNVHNLSRAVTYVNVASGSNISYAITNGANTVQARDNNTVLASIPVTGSCSAGGTWDGSTCKANTCASSGGNISGYAWSENIGWVSFSCVSDSSPTVYGVNVNTATGEFSGYAWSENIGWVSFNAADLVGCPSGVCKAELNLSTGAVTGWARALATDGGWNGWIALSGATSGNTTMNLSTGAFSGYAWDGGAATGVIGWLDFGPENGVGGVLGPIFCSNGTNNPPACNICVAPLTWDGFSCASSAPTISLSASPTLVAVGGASTLSWLSTNATSCSASGSWGGAKAAGVASSQSTGAISPAGTYIYMLTCSGPGGSAVAHTSVTTSSCGNGICEVGETVLNCPLDCKSKVIQF